LGLDLVAGSIRPRIKILEVLCRLCADEIAIGDNHDSILAVPRHDLRPIMKRPVDNLAEARLGILNQESILRAPNRWRRHASWHEEAGDAERHSICSAKSPKLTHSSGDPSWSYLVA
jgi:hypothetical protein